MTTLASKIEERARRLLLSPATVRKQLEEGTGTHVKWEMAFEAKSILGVLPLLPMIHILLNRSMKQTMKNIKERSSKELNGGSQ